MKYLIVECIELGDQWECDADRHPIKVTYDWVAYVNRVARWNKKEECWYFNNSKSIFSFEVYEILENGDLKLIKQYYENTQF